METPWLQVARELMRCDPCRLSCYECLQLLHVRLQCTMLNRNGQTARLGSAPPRAQGTSQGYVRRLQAPIGRGDRTASGARQAAEGEGSEPLFLKQHDYK